MNTKTIIAMNAVWAAVAASAFFLGKSGSVGDASSVADGGQPPSSELAVLSALSPSVNPGSGGRAAGGFVEGSSFSPEEAGRRMSLALAEQDPIRRKSTIAGLLLNLSPDNVEDLLAAFENGPKGDETDRHFRDFLYAWGRMGGEDAIAYAMDPESARRTSWGTTSVVSGWAVSDPEAAKKYVAGVEDVDARQWMHYGVMREMMRSDLDGAIAYSEQNVQSRARGVQMDRLGFLAVYLRLDRF